MSAQSQFHTSSSTIENPRGFWSIQELPDRVSSPIHATFNSLFISLDREFMVFLRKINDDGLRGTINVSEDCDSPDVSHVL